MIKINLKKLSLVVGIIAGLIGLWITTTTLGWRPLTSNEHYEDVKEVAGYVYKNELSRLRHALYEVQAQKESMEKDRVRPPSTLLERIDLLKDRIRYIRKRKRKRGLK